MRFIVRQRPFFLRVPRCTAPQKRPFSASRHRRGLLGPDLDKSLTVPPPPLPSVPKIRPTRWEVLTGEKRQESNAIKVYPPPPSAHSTCKDPISAFTSTQLKTLDPTGARSRLFAKLNPEAAKVGDILLVRQKNGDPFAGVCLNIRRQGIDSAILLRNQLTRVGVEMWYKIYSPNVEGIEVVQRRVKRARRARLYYMRQPKHDLGSVQNIVTQYQRQRSSVRSGSDVKGRGANAQKKKAKKSK